MRQRAVIPMAVDLDLSTADLYSYSRPLGYLLLLLVGIWAVAVVAGRRLVVSNSPYSVADVVAGLAHDRATWAGRTVRVRGRIVQLAIVTAGPALGHATVQHENLPMNMLVCPQGPAGPSASCTIAPAHGIIRVPSHLTSASRQVNLYVRLDSVELDVRPATLWVALRPGGRHSPSTVPWGGAPIYRIALIRGRTRPCISTVCWDGYLLGSDPKGT